MLVNAELRQLDGDSSMKETVKGIVQSAKDQGGALDFGGDAIVAKIRKMVKRDTDDGREETPT